jgi:hypothetical protein
MREVNSIMALAMQAALDLLARERFNMFQKRILEAVAGALMWLARGYYDKHITAHSKWDEELGDTAFQEYMAFLSGCVNDGCRVLDVHLSRLQQEGLSPTQLEILEMQYSDTILHAVQGIAQASLRCLWWTIERVVLFLCCCVLQLGSVA